MEWTALLLIVVIVLFMVTLKLKQKRGEFDSYPYIMNQELFSPSERSFLGVLDQAIGDEYQIFGKVRVADIVSVKPLSDRSVWQQAFNRISAKHFDFVLCRKNDLTVCGTIELDDKSHQKKNRKGRDAFLVGLCDAISLPLVRIPAQRSYSVSDIRSKVLVATELNLSASSQASPINQPEADAHHASIGSRETEVPATDTEEPICPKCSSPMVRRRAKSGTNAGQEFWGCSAFPKCRSIVPVSAQLNAQADRKKP